MELNLVDGHLMSRTILKKLTNWQVYIFIFLFVNKLVIIVTFIFQQVLNPKIFL